jgi:hypothetical protein
MIKMWPFEKNKSARILEELDFPFSIFSPGLFEKAVFASIVFILCVRCALCGALSIVL